MKIKDNTQLEIQRHRYLRHKRSVAQNQVHTYKDAVSPVKVTYKYLGPFNVACIHCGALYSPEERLAKKGNSFGYSCLHGRIPMSPSQFPKELVRLFLRTSLAL